MMTLITVANTKSNSEVIGVDNNEAPDKCTVSLSYIQISNLIWILMALTQVVVGGVYHSYYYSFSYGYSYGSTGSTISIINGVLIVSIFTAGQFSVKYDLTNLVLFVFMILAPLQLTAIITSFTYSRNALMLTLAIANTIALSIQALISRTFLSSTKIDFLWNSVKESLNRPFGVNICQ